jgi:sporulation protein YlmC with PRC-barrel domain
MASGGLPKVIGINVYNDNNEKIGDIQELIVDKSGKVDNVVLGIGGFLGMGEHYVAVPMEKLRWVNEPVRTSSTAPADNGWRSQSRQSVGGRKMVSGSRGLQRHQGSAEGDAAVQVQLIIQ